MRKEFSTLERINKKVEGYEWVRELGHATVAHQVFPSIGVALRENNLDRFVVKPVAGHSSRGVHLLTRDGAGGYACTMTNQRFQSDDAVIGHFIKLQRQSRDKISEAVIIEEFVEDSLGFDVPLDYKVYAFAAGTPFVMQRYAPKHLQHEDWGFEFYDEHGQQLGPIRLNVSSGEKWGMRPPHNLAQMFQVAKDIVKKAQVSFVRVDLYSTPKAIILGEFTPIPNNGQESYIEAYDQLLGDIWRQSLENLDLDYFDVSWEQTPGYLLKKSNAALKELQALRTERDELRENQRTLRTERDALLKKQEWLRNERSTLLKKQEALRTERDALLAKNKQLRASKEAARRQLQTVLGSTSWRLTGPLRAGVSALRRLRRP